MRKLASPIMVAFDGNVIESRGKLNPIGGQVWEE